MALTKNNNLNPLVCKIEVLEIADVQSCVADLGGNYRTVTPKTGKAWIHFYSSPGEVEFEDEQQDDPAGPFFQQKVEFPYPGEDITGRINVANLELLRLMVAITLNSGVKRLMGTPDIPCMAKLSFATEKGGRTITLSCKAPEPAYILV